MSRSCTVCGHPSIAAIDVELGRRRAARRVAAAFGLSYDALRRHARNHVRTEPVPGQATAAPGTGALGELVAALRTRALAGDPAGAREYRLALAAQAAEGTSAPPAYDVRTDPEWLRLVAAMVRALRPFPEARQALADAIREDLEGVPAPETAG